MKSLVSKSRSITNGLFFNALVVLILFFPAVLSGQKSGQSSLKTLSFNGSFINTSKPPVMGSIEDYIESHNERPYEKVFLHTDHQTYLLNDTIWFKAYLWYGYEQQADTASGILYVDLIDTRGKVMKKRKLLIENGTSHGEISLDTTIAPGNYILRSYTRLMQNLNSGDPFYLPLTINSSKQKFHFECSPMIIRQIKNDSLKISFKFAEFDTTGDMSLSSRHRINYTFKVGASSIIKDSVVLENTIEHILKLSLADFGKQDSIAEFAVSVRDKKVNFKESFLIPLQDNIDLQFFPEGGNLVNGLKSKVAFKAVGQDGLGRDIAGEIRTEDDSLVSNFKSTYKGMGMFNLQPSVKSRYSAHFWYKNQKYVVPLPHISKEGTIMTLSLAGNDQILTIKQSPKLLTSSKYVTGSAYGKIWFSAIIKSLIDSARLKIPLDMMPEGVCRLTVIDKDFNPESERLIYIEKNQHFNIDIIPDSLSYSKRSKVTLLIKTTDHDGRPMMADMSLAVIDKDQSPEIAKAPGIKAYKLLKSELRGYIEDPDSYFRNDSTDQSGLNLLMLTQGYRKFLPNSNLSAKQILSPETCFYVSGQIKFNGTKLQEKKLTFPDVGLTLMSVSDKPIVELGHPDSKGYFSFPIPLILGKQRFMVQAKKANGKSFNGDISIDGPLKPPAFTTMPVFNETKSFLKTEYIYRLQAAKKTELSKIKLTGSMSRTLNEVVVTAKANPKNWWHNYDKDAKQITDLDSIDPTGDKYLSINDLLVKEFGAKWYNDESKNMNTILMPAVKLVDKGINFWFPIYLIDGKVYWNGRGFDFTRLSPLSAFPVNEIKRILVIPPGKSIITNYAWEPIMGYPQFILQSMVIIETYSKKTWRGDLPGVKKFVIDGLDVPREFYSPRYEGTMKKNPEYDSRATIFWNPSIITDVTGSAKIEFYTSDRQTTLDAIINGMPIGNGNPGEGHVQIRVAR